MGARMSGLFKEADDVLERYVAIGNGEIPPWGDDRSCPTCGEPDLPLKATSESNSVVLRYISHCGGTWMRGPISRGE
jgi:hypothetical protein